MLDDVGIHPNGYFEASLAYYSKDGNTQNTSGKKFINGNFNKMNNKATPNSRMLDSQSNPASATKNLM